MKIAIIVLAAASVCFAQTGPEKEVLALERQAMDAWAKGDPAAQLAIADSDITYFHIMTEKRLEGIASVRALFEQFRGRPLFDSYEIVDPRVQSAGHVALLTYHLVTRNGEVVRRWNATQVYQRKSDGWRVIHTHFSQTKTP